MLEIADEAVTKGQQYPDEVEAELKRLRKLLPDKPEKKLLRLAAIGVGFAATPQLPDQKKHPA